MYNDQSFDAAQNECGYLSGRLARTGGDITDLPDVSSTYSRAVADYRLRYLDKSGKFIRADPINCDSDPDAIDFAYDRRLPVRSELWRGTQRIAQFPPNGRAAMLRT